MWECGSGFNVVLVAYILPSADPQWLAYQYTGPLWLTVRFILSEPPRIQVQVQLEHTTKLIVCWFRVDSLLS